MKELLLLLIVLPLDCTVSAAFDRPLIFGCGIPWSNTLGLGMGARSDEFDDVQLKSIADMGGTITGASFAWHDVELKEGTYNWTYSDHMVSSIQAHGLKIFAYSGLTPDWALDPAVLKKYGPGIGYRFPPQQKYIPQFQKFFTTLAARYKGKIDVYEFWNEENGCGWIKDGCSNGNQAGTFGPWLKLWYTAMKQGDPSANLALGGLDCSGEDLTACSGYVESLYKLGYGMYFDYVPLHPYNTTGIKYEAVTNVENVLKQHGDQHKQIIIGEYGWNTNNEQHKSQELTGVLTQLKKPEWSYVTMAIYLIITDLPNTKPGGDNFGLASRDLKKLTVTPRASWQAFKSFPKN